MREKLNDVEMGSHQVYQTLNEKLSDKTFLNTVVMSQINMKDVEAAKAAATSNETSESKPDEARTAGGVTFDDKIDLA
jgi:hypothetical protein